MKEVRSVIDTYILNHDRNKRFLALFLALAILVSFAVPASLIQPANSMTANSDGGATVLSDTTGIEVSTTVGAPATGNGRDDNNNMHWTYFTEVCPFIPMGADDLESHISSVSVTVTDYSGKETEYTSQNGQITIPAGSSSDIKFELDLSYTLDSAAIAKLSSSEPCMYYVLPDGFAVLEDIYGINECIVDDEYPNDNGIAAHVSVDDATGLIVIQFTQNYINYLKTKGSATGAFALTGTMGRSETADGDSSINVGDFNIEVEFDDTPNDVNKGQGVVTPNANGGADIEWVITVRDAGYGINGWSVTDANFPSGGNGVVINPDGFGSWNGTTYTFTSEPSSDYVTFTYTQTLTAAQIEALYDSNNLTVKNDVSITNPDGLTDSTTNNAYLTRPTVEKSGVADYETGEYNNTINWEIVVESPYGTSLNGYVVTDTYLSQHSTTGSSTLVVKDKNGNVLTNGTDYSYNNGDSLTILSNHSEVVITYSTNATGGNAYTNNVVIKDGNTQIDTDSETVNYEKSTNLSKKGVYDPETNKIYWIVTAESHVGILDEYSIWDTMFNNDGFSLGEIKIAQAYSDATEITNITYGADSITLGSYGTITFNSAQGNSSIIIDSNEGSSGLTMVQFYYVTELAEGQTSANNSIDDHKGNNDTVTVTPSCQYTLNKTGSFNAVNGTIEWTISVKNDTDLSVASLEGVTLTDAALKGMSASDLVLSWAKDTSGGYNYTLSASGNVVTIKDSSDKAVATLTVDSATGTITFSNVADGFNDIGLKYAKPVDDASIKAGSDVSNQLSADVPGDFDPDPVEKVVDVTNYYNLQKTGAYDASTGNIIWTVTVENTAGTLGGLTLTDDAFENLASGTSIEISSANGYNWGTVHNITSTGTNNSFAFEQNGTSYGSMSLSGDTITFTNADNGYGAQKVVFTYQTKPSSSAEGAQETNTISSNRIPDEVSDTVTITNPYQMNKSGATYDAETGLITWRVSIQNGSNQWNGDATLDGVVLFDEAFKGLSIDNINVTSGIYSYHTLNVTTKNGNVITVKNSYDEVFGTLTLDPTNGTLSFADDGTRNSNNNDYYYGLYKIEFTYTTKATDEEISQGFAQNIIGTHSSGVGPSSPSSDSVNIQGRDEMTKTYNGSDVTVYGDTNSSYELSWTINMLKDDGYSTGDLILVDELTATGAGKHYITSSQLGAIVVQGKEYTSGSFATLDSSMYEIVGTDSDSDGNYESFSIKFNEGIDTANYRYLQITYKTTADVSGIEGTGSGTTVTFNNNASFGVHNNVGDDFKYTEIPADYVETIGVTVQKTWNDENNKFNTRTDSVKVALLYKIESNGEWTYYDKDGDGTIEVSGDNTDDLYEISAANSWSLSIQNLPKTTSNAQGLKPIYYMVEEVVSVDSYTTTYVGNYGVNTNGSIINVINSLDCIKVNKTWNDSNNAYTTRPNSIEVQLQYRAKGSADEWANVDGGLVTIPDASGNWSYTFTGIDPDLYEYKVVETAVDGYKTTYSNNSGISSGTIEITNTLVTVNVSKQWQGLQNGATPPDISVTLEYSSDNGSSWQPYTDGNGNAYTATLTSGSLSTSWHGLNPNYIYRVVESEITEGSLDSFITTYSSQSIDGVTNQNFTITNTSNNLTVYKIWQDSGNEDKRQEVVINLYEVADDNTKTLIDTQTIVDATTDSFKSYTWYGLDPNKTYYVEEVSIDGYVTSYSTNNISGGSINVTNTYNSIKIDKVWKDISGNTITPDVDSITLEIYQSQNGAPAISGNITTPEISTDSESGNIVAIFDLPDLQKGDILTVKLNGPVDWVANTIQYNGALGGNNSDGKWVSIPWNGTIDHWNKKYIECTFEITEDITDAVIQTYWNDKDSTQNYISSVDYSIQRWTLYDTITVTPDANGNWNYTVSGLDTGIAPGEYIYKVVEKTVDGYNAVYTNNDGVSPTSNQTISITNQEAETVDKFAHDKDGNVIANGSLIKPSNLQKATIDGVECYIIKYKLTHKKTYSNDAWVVDTLPSGWEICEGSGYGPFVYNGTTQYDMHEWNDFYKNNGSTVSFNLKWYNDIEYYIRIPVATLDAQIEANNSVLIENTAALEGENSQPTTNKIYVSNSTSSGGTEDADLLDKTASLMNGKLQYTIVVNPDGKNLANGDVIDLVDKFDIVDYILKNNGGSLTASQLEQMEATLDSLTVKSVLNITTDEYGNLNYTEVDTLSPLYFIEYKPTETETKTYTFTNTSGTKWTSDCTPGDVVTVTVKNTRDLTGVGDSQNASVILFADENGNTWPFSTIYMSQIGTYDASNWTTTATVTVPDGAVSIIVDDWLWPNQNISAVSGVATKSTLLSTATLNMTIPDETPIIITYSYIISGITMTEGDKLSVNNSVSFDTGNYSSSDTAEKKEFLISDAFGTITAGTSPTIKKVSISDYSIEVAAEFKMAYYDETYGWIFAVDELKGDNNAVTPIWPDSSNVSNYSTTGNTIPSGTHTFKLGSIDINLEDGKLYKLIEVSMPFGYQGYNLAADYNKNHKDSTDTTYAAYITAVNNSMTAAGRTEAIFEDLLQGYLAGHTGPYDEFFAEFEPVYYFAYQDADYDKPAGFNETVTTVSTTGELLLNNSEMIEISIDKKWDETALEAIGGEEVDVKSIVKLYWSTMKKSTGFPEGMLEVNDTYFNSLKGTDFVNPQFVAKDQVAKWGLLPSGYQGKPVYYYVKEIGYQIGDDSYYLIDSIGEYVLATISDDGTITPIDKDGNPVNNSADYVLGKLKPIYTGNGTNNSNDGKKNDEGNKKVTIDIQNTAGLKIEKIWKNSDNTDLIDPPLTEVPIVLYGTLASTGEEKKIGTFIVGTSNDWNLVIDEDEHDLSKYKSFRVVENVPVDQQHLIYGYSVSYTYNTNGPSGTITVTNKDNTPTEIDVSVKKEWSDGDDHSADSVTLQLYQTTAKQPTEGVNEEGGVAYGESIPLDASKNWSYTWTELDYKDPVSGMPYYYYVIETTYDVASGKTYKQSYSRSDLAKKQSLTVTNYIPGSINIEKSWVDKNGIAIDSDSLLLPEGIQIDIYRRPDEPMISEGGATLPSGIKVFADGDSITNGYWNPPSPYPSVLQELLTSNGSTGSTVTNAGQSGHFISQIPHNGYSAGNDLLTLIIGTNDLNSDTPISEIISSYEDMLDRIKAVDATTVLFVGGIPHEDFLNDDGSTTDGYTYVGGDWSEKFSELRTACGYDDNNITNADRQAFEDAINNLIDQTNAEIKKLVESYEGLEIRYVDITSAVDKDTELRDGCHPSQKGYDDIAQAFYDAINTYYGVGTMETPKDIDDVPENIKDTTKYEHVGTYTLEADKDWKDSIELPTMNDSNVNYVYYVVEKTTGYTVAYDSNGQVIGDSDGDTIYVTNTVDTQKTSITVEKVWYDNNSGDRPSSVQLQLQQRLETEAGWTNIGEKFTLTADDEWTTTITDLDVTDLNGVKYYYQVVETVPDGYAVVYSEENGDVATAAGTTITVTNTKTFDLTVKKIWSDPDHLLQEGVTINIYRDTEENTSDSGLTLIPIELQLVTPADGNLTVTKGKTATVTVNKAGTSVSFSNNLATAVVNDKTITVTAGDTTGNTVMTITDEAGQTVEVNITVSDKPTLSLALSPSTILAGATSEISAELSDGTPTDGITYEITSGNAATLSGNTLTGVNKGTVTVKGTLVVDGDTYTAEATLNVTLTDSFTLDASSTTVNVGGEVTVTPDPEFGTPFEYTSSDESIATVDSSGKVTGVSAGTVTITAERSDGEKATVDITVPLTVSPESVTMSANGSQQLTVNSTNVDYDSSNTAVVTVSDTGLITAVGDGSATITVATKDGKQSKTVNVTVSSGPLATVGSSGYTLNLDSSKTVERIGITFGDVDITNQWYYNLYGNFSDYSSIGLVKLENGALTVSDSNNYNYSISSNTLTYSINRSNLSTLTFGTNNSTWEIENIVVTYSDGTVVTYSAASPNGSTSSGGGDNPGGDTTPLVITPSSVELTVGGASATLTANKDGVTYTIKTGDDYITLSGNTVSPVAAGEAVITATCGDETVDIPVTVSESTGGGEIGGSSVDTPFELGWSGASATVTVDTSKTIGSVVFSIDSKSWAYAEIRFDDNNYVKAGYYDTTFQIESNNSKLTNIATEIDSSGNVTITFLNGYQPSAITVYDRSNGSTGTVTVNYASAYSLRNRVSYAPPSRAYALLADVTYPELVATIKITSSDTDWTKIIADLPVYDASGNPYYYWIEEVDANGFTPSYRFEDGDDLAIDADYCINAANPGDAIATVENTPNDTQTALPSTGGQGMQKYYVTGIGIMLCALAGIYGFKRRQRSQS